MRKPQIISAIITIVILLGAGYLFFEDKINKPGVFSNDPGPSVSKKSSKPGKVIDTYAGVKVYFNGKVSNVSGRNLTKDGYNLGLKYQCVEFVKRFYYEKFNHKMPDSYGHAKDFYQAGLEDGAFSKSRDLYQYLNEGSSMPQVNDIVVFGATPYNRFGHVAIVSNVKSNSIEIVQQNPGLGVSSRVKIPMSKTESRWKIEAPYLTCWLRKG